MKKIIESAISVELIARKIYLIRGSKAMLDSDLAFLYEVSTRELVQVVKRNGERFPEDFMFQLTLDEWKDFQNYRLKEVEKIPPQDQELANLRSQFVISSSQVPEISRLSRGSEYGGRRSLPYCFTEQGVTMLSAVLRSPRAISVSIEVVRTFIKLRQILVNNTGLARRLTELEDKYDQQFKVVFDAIRELMMPPETKKKRIGFGNG